MVDAERLVAAVVSEIDTAADPEAGLLGDAVTPMLLGGKSRGSFPDVSMRGELLKLIPGTP